MTYEQATEAPSLRCEAVAASGRRQTSQAAPTGIPGGDRPVGDISRCFHPARHRSPITPTLAPVPDRAGLAGAAPSAVALRRFDGGEDDRPSSGKPGDGDPDDRRFPEVR